MTCAWYNENDPFAAAWLRELIADGLIAPGDVDERSIRDVQPGDLRSYTQCHFFAGIGVWSYALRQAGFGDARPVWTGSCPCQPFSAAGQQRGHDDDRHLWPVWFQLIRECQPDLVFGEQVEQAIRHGWLDLVCGDLEGEGYAVGPVVFGAHSVGAPHKRQRLYFVAESSGQQLRRGSGRGEQDGGVGEVGPNDRSAPTDAGALGDVGDAERARLEGHDGHGGSAEGWTREDRPTPATGARAGAEGRMADTASDRAEGDAGEEIGARGECGPQPRGGGELHAGHAAWSDIRWIDCRDGKRRPVPVEPALFPLVDGPTRSRVGLLRGAGNALVAPQAQAFIEAYLDHDAD